MKNQHNKKSTGRLIVSTWVILVIFWTVVLSLVSTRTQAQFNLCDSLSYSIVTDSATWNTLMVTGNANGISNMVDSIGWNFTACNSTACYIPQGNDPYSFPLIYPSDTVKLCYDAFVYTMGTTIMCNHCDSLIYDFMSDTWVIMLRNNPVGIEELIKNEGMYKMYDMLGRELTEIPLGEMYIRNQKLYITR